MEDRLIDEASPSDIKEDYFYWLCGIIHADDPDCSFFYLMEQLFNHEFYWSVYNDDNRASDGELLRDDFLSQSGYSDSDAIGGPCTVLEMLVALACRIDEEIMWKPNENRTVVWFWEMIENLGLDGYDDDHVCPGDAQMIHYILDRWLSRKFRSDGVGSIFPLRGSSEDLRKVEIWYQMNFYFLHKYGVEEDACDVV